VLIDLSLPQSDLADYMSDLSESAYSARWMTGLEFALWDAVVNGPFKYGRLRLADEHIRRLKELSDGCKGWIRFDDINEETFVPFAEWEFVVKSNGSSALYL
jgi:hypothetical protein